MILSHSDVQNRISRMASDIRELFPFPYVYPIPRGGIPVAYLLKAYGSIYIVDRPEEAQVFVDDLIDSGRTRNRMAMLYPDVPFFALLDKKSEGLSNEWIVFPWEAKAEGGIEDNIIRLLQYVGENAEREGLRETPQRVAKAWQHWCSGYKADPASVLKVFEDGAESYDQMIVVKDIPFYSHCEHHLAPIFGNVTIAYIPNKKIAGLSKLSRLTDIFARRLQVQERMTEQIADALHNHLAPIGVGVFVKARHLCMESRGVCQQGHYTITTALRGAIKEEAQTRAEFLRVCRP